MKTHRLYDVDHLAAAAAEWVEDTFGTKVLQSREERALRILEEALEVAQASGVPREQVYALVPHVFDKPIGVVEEELTDLTFCTLTYTHILGMNICEQVQLETDAVYRNMALIQRRYADKVERGLTAFKPGELEDDQA